MRVKLSLVISARDVNDPKLKELLESIDRQNFPKDEMEVLIITDGNSESAKAIGIRRAKGDIIGILASDNELIEKDFLNLLYFNAFINGASQPAYYHHMPDDALLNRYFSLIGGNDPLAFYMNKQDRLPFLDSFSRSTWINQTIGDNGYFVKKELIANTDLDHYYHIDNAIEAGVTPVLIGRGIWHKTGDNIFSSFRKRYHHGLQHAFNKNRRWHLVDFSKPKDIARLLWFIFVTLTILEPLLLSIRGYLKIRDVAWFLHWPICLATLFTYGILVVDLGIKQLSQLLFAPMAVQKA